MNRAVPSLLAIALVLSACTAPPAATPSPAWTETATPPASTATITPTGSSSALPPIPTVVLSDADGLLAEILTRGSIVISTDPDYQPQSFRNPAGQRPDDTRCASDQLTGPELQGFDIDVSLQIGLRLGVEPCFVTPSFLAVEAGNWGNMWDISVGSMRITPARMKVLAFTSPYYYEDGAIPLGIAIDHGHTLSIGSLVAALNQVVEHMHNDGTLAGLSIKWFGKDLSAK